MRVASRLRLIVCALGLVGSVGAVESKAQVLLSPRIGQAAVGAARHRNRSMAGYAAGRNRAGQGQGVQQVARELMMTRALLQRGDHDYNGHRARAVGDINRALAALGHGNNGMNATGGVRPGGNRAGNGMNGARREPQAVSDGQLRQALQNLNTISMQLGTANNPRVARARIPVQRAMTELNTALTIR